MAKKAQHSDTALVIVESPAKARTIGKYLGPGYTVESSIGHVRDLPSKAAEVPPEFKQEEWARLGVNVNDKFKPLYVILAAKKARIVRLRKALEKSCTLYLATDEDREGEAIAWHLTEVLRPTVPVKRMVFDEITSAAIRRAVDATRDIDMKLVNAQEARRILDRLYGYEVSPILWRKVGPKLSAGRVQSVATRLVVDRERARMRFVRAEYWDIEAKLRVGGEGSEELTARLIELGGRALADGRDFDDSTGRLKPGRGSRVLTGAEAQALADVLGTRTFGVTQITPKPFTHRPYPPFITSTLQQEAARKLGVGAQRTMRLAQHLYENGYITYMRTDSTHLSSQAIHAARAQAAELYGQESLPDKPRTYASRVKNAQEAHEAIRPAGESFRLPKTLEGELEPDAWRLYDLIWKRTVASQMRDAQGVHTAVQTEVDAGAAGLAVFGLSGTVLTFAGFLRAYVEGSDDPEAELADREQLLPPLKEGQRLTPVEVRPLAHATQPPARYTEASLIREMEERGIGRPSTYATIVQTIQERGYVRRKGAALVPTFTAFAVTQLLERHLTDLVDYDFTAKMESDLDAIANGDREAIPWLHDFYFGRSRGGGGNGGHVGDVGLHALIGVGAERIDPRAISSIPIGTTREGQPVVVRVGRYGPYVQIGDGDQRASLPDDLAPDELSLEKAIELLAEASYGDRVLGTDPATDRPVYIKTGRFGPYVQLGDPELTEKGAIKKGSEPRRASLWPSMSARTITLNQALLLLSFPRVLGVHPVTGLEVSAQDGRFGPYVKMGSETRSVEAHDKLATITIEEAIELFRQPKKSSGRARRGQTLAELGPHPATGDPIQVKAGRYGTYVTDGVVNATIAKGKDPATVTLDEAIGLILAREEQLKAQGKDARTARKRRKNTTTAAEPETTPRAAASGRPGRSAKATRAPRGAPRSLGAPSPGFAWTRTGKPVVEVWPEGTLACPACGSAMTLKRGRFGPFFSCAGYPQCKMVANVRGAAKERAEREAPPSPQRPEPIPTDIACTLCGQPMVIRRSRGRPFLGCGAYPTCKSTQPLPAELEPLAAGSAPSRT